MIGADGDVRTCNRNSATAIMVRFFKRKANSILDIPQLHAVLDNLPGTDGRHQCLAFIDAVKVSVAVGFVDVRRDRRRRERRLVSSVHQNWMANWPHRRWIEQFKLTFRTSLAGLSSDFSITISPNSASHSMIGGREVAPGRDDSSSWDRVGSLSKSQVTSQNTGCLGFCLGVFDLQIAVGSDSPL